MPARNAPVVALLLLAVFPLHGQRRAYYFGELGGPGGVASINVDLNPAGALHLRAGLGFFIWPSVPITATYAIGSARHSLEVGGGITPVFLSAYDTERAHRGPGSLFDRTDDGVLVVTTASLAYRYASEGGFLFRAALVPMFAQGERFLWFGLGIGRAF